MRFPALPFRLVPPLLAAPIVAALFLTPGALAAQAAAPPSHEAAALAALAADSALILDDLRYLASDDLRGRGVGTEGSRLARVRLAQRFAEAGLEPLTPGFEHAFTFTRRNDPEERTGINLIAVRPGSHRPGLAIVVSGHYDHVGERNGEIFNGADDNASGAVGIAALARALRGIPLRHTVVFASFDAEESGLQGARAFVAEPPVPVDSIALNVNLDMVARTAGLLWAAGAYHTPSLRPVLEGVAARSPVEVRLGHDRPEAPEGDDWTRQSDHFAFHSAGIPFVYLGVEDHDDYHRPTDDFDRVDPSEYMNALRAALMAVLAMDRALPLDRTPSPTP